MIDPIVFEDFNASKTMVSGVMVNTAIYKLAFEQSEHGLAIISLDERRFLDVNARFCRYMSRERDQLIGTQLSVIVGANDFEDIKARLAAYKNEVGGLACCELDVSRYLDEAHQQGFLLITLRDLTEYKTTELLAKSTAEQLEALLDAVPAGIWLAHDQNCNRTSCNQVAREWIQVPKGEGDFFATDAQPANSSWATTLNAGGSQLDVSYLPLSRAARGERVDNFEGQIVLNDGQKRYIFGNARPLFDAQGMPRGAVSAYIDVTDIKRAEARENLLAREVDHRARNVLSVIQAIVQLSTATSLEALKSRIAGRIGSLARAHTLLSDSRWHSVDLRKLISQELEPFGFAGADNSRRFLIDGPDIALRPAAAQSLALVVHELATNAAKYGALSQPNGKLRIDWDIVGDDADSFGLSWWEYDISLAAEIGEAGFGATVIRTSVEDQLRGKLLSSWLDTGLKVEICCPVEEVTNPSDIQSYSL